MPYVVTEGRKVPESGGEPESIRNVYDDWDSCLAAITGSTGPRYMKVSNQEEAEAILSGKGVVLAPGLYAFTDGNSFGGVGVAIVRMSDEQNAEPQLVQEIPTSVDQVFRGSMIPGLESDLAVSDVLRRLSMHLAELAAVYVAVREVQPGDEVTIVYDRESVGSLMQGQSRSKDHVASELVSESQKLAKKRRVSLSFKHQPGHRKTWAGRHDLAKYNALADELTERRSNDSTSIDN